MKVFVIGGTTVPDTDDGIRGQLRLLKRTMTRFGNQLVAAGHDLLVCSPFPASVDEAVLRGAAPAVRGKDNPTIEMHFPDSKSVTGEVNALKRALSLANVKLFTHPLPIGEDCKEEWGYGWLLAQLFAMDRSHAVVAVGGKANGSANLLLLLAEGRRKPILPLTYLGGAAAQAFQRQRYQLEDRLGDRLAVLEDADRADEVVPLIEYIQRDQISPRTKPSRTQFFISYARARPHEADFVEITLRRRNCTVFRDERDFGAGRSIPNEITEFIHRADVFVVLWCKEYACSPWCFDELELALKHHGAETLTLWIFCVDETRIVPPLARNLTNYPARSREELERHVLALLEQLERE